MAGHDEGMCCALSSQSQHLHVPLGTSTLSVAAFSSVLRDLAGLTHRGVQCITARARAQLPAEPALRFTEVPGVLPILSIMQIWDVEAVGTFVGPALQSIRLSTLHLTLEGTLPQPGKQLPQQQHHVNAQAVDACQLKSAEQRGCWQA